MPYLTKAPLLLVKVPDQVGDGYRVDYHYQGSTIPWLSDEQANRFLDEGLVESVGGRKAKGPAPVEVPPGVPVGNLDKPAHVATKDVWVDYAVSQGASRDEAEALTKAELVELYGG